MLRFSEKGLEPEEIEALTDAISKALAQGPLTRKDLTERALLFLESGRTQARRWLGHAWGGAVKMACLKGLVCFGPNRGQEVTFVRQDKWLPGQRTSQGRAEPSLVARYLHGYGPATPQDFAAWSAMTARETMPIWDRLSPELVELDIDGKRAWALRTDWAELKSAKLRGPSVRLLPSFDAFLLGHRDKSHLVDDAYYKRIFRKAGWLSPVVLVNGRAQGVWGHRRRGKRLDVTVELFRRPERGVQDKIEAEATGLGRFFGIASEVRFN
jgi:hypothetical protein